MRFSKPFKKILLMILAVAVLGGFFSGGFVLGRRGEPQTVYVSGKDLPLDVDFSLFWEAIQALKRKFVDIDNVSDETLLYGAIRGAVNSLKDPYTVFFDPSDAKKFEEDISGNFGGIGAEIGIRKNQLVVIAPLKGNPAEEVGLQAMDKILKVDDTFTNDLSLEDAVKLIRGEIGTEVTLLILRDGWEEPREFKIIRRNIVVPTLDWEMKGGEDKIAYFQLYNFNANATSLFYEAALSASLEGVRGIVFDLRNNPGGFLEVANDLAGWFLPRGSVVVRERFVNGKERVFRANGNAAFANTPVVLLVNGGSASASEIFAGALRDLRGATLVGEKTFGKGTVQELETLRDSSTIKVSVAEWVTPNGNQIDGKGLEPDVTVEFTEEDAEAERDPQLERALQILRTMI